MEESKSKSKIDSDDRGGGVKAISKQPFLRKRSGLLRFFKNVDMNENQEKSTEYAWNTEKNNQGVFANSAYTRQLLAARLNYAQKMKNTSEGNIDSCSSSQSNNHFDGSETATWKNYNTGTTGKDDEEGISDWESIDFDSTEEDGGSEGFDNTSSARSRNSDGGVEHILQRRALTFDPDSESDTETEVNDIMNEEHSIPSRTQSEIDFRTPSHVLSEADGDKELEIFEIMEKATERQSFCSTSSTVQKFINNTELKRKPYMQVKSTSKPEGPRRNLMSPDVMQQVLELVKEEDRSRQEELSTNSEFQSVLMTAKTLELEAQIEKYKAATRRAEEMRRMADEKLVELNNSKRIFEETKIREYTELESERSRLKTKREELNIITREMNKKLKAQSKFTSNEEQVTKLQAKVEVLEKDIQIKTQRWACTARTMKSTMEKLRGENTTLTATVEKLSKEKALREVQTARVRMCKIGQRKSSSSILEKGDRRTNDDYPLEDEPQAIRQHKSSSGILERGDRRTNDDYSLDDAPPAQKSLREMEAARVRMCKIDQPKSSTWYLERGDRRTNDDYPVEDEPHAYVSRKIAAVFSERSPSVGKENESPTPNGLSVTDSFTHENGNRQVTYSNGSTKIFDPEGICTKIVYMNGDIKDCGEIESGKVRYYYHEKDTWQTTYADGSNIYSFPSGHIEKRYPDGLRELTDPSGKMERVYPNGTKEIQYPDKMVARIEPNGNRALYFPNGQIEYHTNHYKKRVYPCGTEKIVHSDGSQETHYNTGRRRFKDTTGRVIFDGMMEDFDDGSTNGSS